MKVPGGEPYVYPPAAVTVLHNGVVVHNHFELHGSTSYVEAAKYGKHAEKLPIHIQDHGNPVRYRNLWIRENIQPLQGKLPEAKPAEEKPAEPKEDAKPAAETR